MNAFQYMVSNRMDAQYIKIVALVSLVLNVILIFACIELNSERCSESKKIDFEMKNLDDCYLTLQNIIKIDISNETKTKNHVNSFIYSATKPFLIELLNNSTNDCVCGQNYFNEHLNL